MGTPCEVGRRFNGFLIRGYINISATLMLKEYVRLSKAKFCFSLFHSVRNYLITVI